MRLNGVTVTLKPYSDTTYIDWNWMKNRDYNGSNIYADILEWCTIQFGAPDDYEAEDPRWQETLIIGSLTFHQKKDAELFLLRWA